MSSKMVIRILSISLALLLLGMFFPGLSKASISVESPDNSLNFGNVAIDSEKMISLRIKNENDPDAADPITITLYFNLYSQTAACGFSFDVNAQPQQVPAGEIGYVDITYKPSGLTECSGPFYVLWIGGGKSGNLLVTLMGKGVPSAPSTVVIDGQDTEVENRLYTDERYISEWLDECAVNAPNHGQYVRCVALLTKNMKKANLLNEEEKGAIMKAAAHANIPPRKSGIDDLSHDGTPVTELIKDCKENAENNRQYVRCVSDLMKEMKRDGVIKTRKDKHLIRRYAARLRSHDKHHK